MTELKTITGSINVTKGSAPGFRQLKSNSDWFKNSEFYTIKSGGDCLIVTKHYIDVPIKAQRSKVGHFTCKLDIPLGKFNFDEEDSTEDELIIYFDL